MAQIISITSEALQATVRRLLPSQRGFGEDLQATNVVTPIIDLTPSAQGADTPTDLRRALGFGSITSFDVANTTTTLVNTPGFFSVLYSATMKSPSVAAQIDFRMTDGASSKQIFQMLVGVNEMNVFQGSFDVFLRSGESLTATSTDADVNVSGVTQQFADSAGNLITPTGFNPE